MIEISGIEKKAINHRRNLCRTIKAASAKDIVILKNGYSIISLPAIEHISIAKSVDKLKIIFSNP